MMGLMILDRVIQEPNVRMNRFNVIWNLGCLKATVHDYSLVATDPEVLPLLGDIIGFFRSGRL